MTKKNKLKANKAFQKDFETFSKEDREDLMNMDSQDLREVARELRRDNQPSQAESLAKELSKLSPEERSAELTKLKKEDILQFETVEYLLKRLLARK